MRTQWPGAKQIEHCPRRVKRRLRGCGGPSWRAVVVEVHKLARCHVPEAVSGQEMHGLRNVKDSAAHNGTLASLCLTRPYLVIPFVFKLPQPYRIIPVGSDRLPTPQAGYCILEGALARKCKGACCIFSWGRLRAPARALQRQSIQSRGEAVAGDARH